MEIRAGFVVLFAGLAALLIIALVIAFAYGKDLRAARAVIDGIRTELYESRFGTIEYLLVGEGPTILVSHGVSGGIDQGFWLTEDLAKEYRFLYVSRFGYLASSMPEGPSIGKQAAAYRELLDHLEIGSAYVMGNSAGGSSALKFAEEHADRCDGVILVSSVVPTSKPLPPRAMAAVFSSDFFYWATVRLLGTGMLTMFIPDPILKAATAAERRFFLQRVFLSGLPITRRTEGVIFDSYTSNPAVATDIDFAAIVPAVLMFHAADDPAPPIEGARYIASVMPDCELVEYPTGGHLLLGHAGDIRDRIHAFVFFGR